ncbi:biotin/lipoyl-binding protein, partial [Calditrichota bacterium]
MKIFADIKDETMIFDLVENGDKPILKDSTTNYEYDLKPIGNDRYFFRLNGKSALVQIYHNNNKYHVNIEGEVFEIRVEDERKRTLRELVKKASQTSGEQIITAPIPGLITTIKIKEGDQISPGDSLIVL